MQQQQQQQHLMVKEKLLWQHHSNLKILLSKMCTLITDSHIFVPVLARMKSLGDNRETISVFSTYFSFRSCSPQWADLEAV